MHYKPTIPALIFAAYRTFKKHGPTALLLAAMPAVVSGWISIKAFAIDAAWLRVVLQIGAGMVQLIYVTALLRAVDGKTALKGAYRLWRDEGNAVLAGLVLGATLALPLLLLSAIADRFGLDHLIFALIGNLVIYVVALRMILLLPLIVLEGRGALNGVTGSWRMTHGSMFKLLISGAVAILPGLSVVHFIAGAFTSRAPLMVTHTDTIIAVVLNYFAIGLICLFGYAVYVTQKTWANLPEPAKTPL